MICDQWPFKQILPSYALYYESYGVSPCASFAHDPASWIRNPIKIKTADKYQSLENLDTSVFQLTVRRTGDETNADEEKLLSEQQSKKN